MKDTFEEILSDYPEFLSRSDLINLGIWKNKDAAWSCQNKGGGPPYIKVGRRVLYLKKDLLNFFRLSYRGKDND